MTYQMSVYTFRHLNHPLCAILWAKISAVYLWYSSVAPYMHGEKHCCHHNHGSMDHLHSKATDKKYLRAPKLLLYEQEFVCQSTYKNKLNKLKINAHKTEVQSQPYISFPSLIKNSVITPKRISDCTLYTPCTECIKWFCTHDSKFICPNVTLLTLSNISLNLNYIKLINI